MSTPKEKLDLHFKLAAKTFPHKVQEALELIGEPTHQLLALRRYIRKAKDLNKQWVWSAEQIHTYEAGPEFGKVQHQIQIVKEKFATLNPGYTLGVSPIRDLKRQVRLWNGNKTVHRAGDDLEQKCLLEIANYPEAPDAIAIEKFRKFLGQCSVDPEPTSAAPGLSDHGQMNAIDFVVFKDKTKIADTKSATIGTDWDKPGWTDKLKNAVTLSGSQFKGPLQHPREPWHYTLPH
jgi:hypothetical protein